MQLEETVIIKLDGQEVARHNIPVKPQRLLATWPTLSSLDASTLPESEANVTTFTDNVDHDNSDATESFDDTEDDAGAFISSLFVISC